MSILINDIEFWLIKLKGWEISSYIKMLCCDYYLPRKNHKMSH